MFTIRFIFINLSFMVLKNVLNFFLTKEQNTFSIKHLVLMQNKLDQHDMQRAYRCVNDMFPHQYCHLLDKKSVIVLLSDIL